MELGQLLAPEMKMQLADSGFLDSLNSSVKPSWCQYYFAAGINPDKFMLTWVTRRFYNYNQTPNDGLIERASALGEGLSIANETKEFWSNHSTIVSDPAVMNQIVDWLKIYPPPENIESSFKVDDEGWRLVNTKRGSAAPLTVVGDERIPKWIQVVRPEIGYVGGKLRGEDWVDGMFCWKAPNKFVGDLSGYHRGTLEYDLWIFGDRKYDGYSGPEVALFNSNGQVIVCDQLFPYIDLETHLCFEIALEAVPHADYVKSQWHHGVSRGQRYQNRSSWIFLVMWLCCLLGAIFGRT